MELVRRQSIAPDGPEWALYHQSFPEHERRLWPAQQMALAHPDYHFDVIWEGGAFAGLILWWEAEGFLYVEHFCIEPELRGKGLGQRALRLLTAKGKPVILEIDPPVDEISIRRKGFYERALFCANPWPHVHPPYRPGNSGHALVVMSAPGALTLEEYGAFSRYLADAVMGGVMRLGEGLIFRTPAPGEARSYWQMLDGLDRETEFMMYEPGERGSDLGRIERMLSAAQDRPDQMFVQVAEVNGQMAGFVSASRDGHRRAAHSAYVVAGIRAEFQGQGLGSRLFERLIAWASENGVLRLELTVFCDNRPAIALYRKFGFEIEGTRRCSMRVGGAFKDEYEMARVRIPREG